MGSGRIFADVVPEDKLVPKIDAMDPGRRVNPFDPTGRAVW